MSDLVECLREGVDGDPDVGLAPANDIMREAADHIERLEAALRKIEKVPTVFDGGSIQWCRTVAAKALQETGDATD